MIKFFKRLSRNAYGFGRKSELRNYLYYTYKGHSNLLEEKELDLPIFPMSHLENNTKNCTLTAITRVMKYYRDLGYQNIPESENEIYNLVKSKGLERGFYYKWGTIPIMISSIIRKSFNHYGYDVKSKGVFLWEFKDHVKREIDNGRPVILNISRGYYRNHTVTVDGYRIYKINGKEHIILIIHDGWNKELRYLDYDMFANSLLFAGLGSFNNVSIKINISKK